ncbi:V-SNARE coiled-coil domain-containing protein [Citrus sinensis]|uniref:V-SNARE coiled-coil domain-containing protein n=1 Tax=Citrus sinensis TaxID=2711 RepID=A0ACB8L106_CITSI|nr:V-SNARE coiled-coil domain-containing protein [Citrus sinensis]
MLKNDEIKENLTSKDFDPRVTLHYGIPSTASILAFDHVQSLLAIGTQDGRIKVIGGDNIEGLLVSPKQLAFKHLEFLQNQGFLVSISSGNEIQLWDLEARRITSTLPWESNITAFSVIFGTSYMYIGDEYGMVYVLKYDAEEGKLIHSPYYVPKDVIEENRDIFLKFLLLHRSFSGRSYLLELKIRHTKFTYVYLKLLVFNHLLLEFCPNHIQREKGKAAFNASLLFYCMPPDESGFIDFIIRSKLRFFVEIRYTIYRTYEGIGASEAGNGTRTRAPLWFLLLLVYANGLIILWDVSEDKVVLVRGSKDLQLKTEIVDDPSKNAGHNLSETVSDNEQVEKEISSLCWASNDGSVLAVGYVDGDILLWNLRAAASTKDWKSENSSTDFGKLQLSSGNRRLPVITLHWSAERSRNDCRGQLFVFGGDEIGSEEVLTMLYLNWSSRIESLKCIGRVDLERKGSFVDMVLLPNGMNESHGTLPCVLTNPGKLQVYDRPRFSPKKSQEKKKISSSSLQYPMLIPTIEPHMTVGKLCMVCRDGKLSVELSKTLSAAKVRASHTPSTQLTGSTTKWPLTGGIPCQLHDAEDYLVERLYIAGYRDGSTRIWDATYPTLSLIHVFGSELPGIRTATESESVSALEFCSVTLNLAIGSSSGLVWLYNLIKSSNEETLNLVTETGKEVHILPDGDGPQCKAIFSVLNSPICNLKFSNFGARLAVGFECSQVAMLDISTFSVLFITDSLSNSNSPVLYLAVKSLSDTSNLTISPKDSDINTSNDTKKEALFFMTKDAHIVVCDSTTEGGNFFSETSSEKQSLNTPQNSKATSEPDQTNANTGSDPVVAELETSTEATYLERIFEHLFVLLCYEDALWLYPLKSLIQINGFEFAFMSLFSWENDFRIPVSYPHLHDKVLEAAADATIDLSPAQRKEEGTALGILGGIIKGFKADKAEQNVLIPEVSNKTCAHLDSIFSNPPFLKPSTDIPDDKGVIELNIDDIDIDGPLIVTSSSQTSKNDRKDKGKERKKLFEGAATDTKPKSRTVDEIKAKYKKSEGAAAAAAQAKDKLAERGEKLEMLRERTEELQNGAQNFADLAGELAKRMERRKWWQL